MRKVDVLQVKRCKGRFPPAWLSLLAALLGTLPIMPAATAAQEDGPRTPASASSETSEGGVRITAFDRYIVGGGWVTIFCLIPLSVTALSLALLNAWSIRRRATVPASMVENLCAMLERGDYSGAIQLSSSDSSLLARVLYAGFLRSGEGFTAMRRAMDLAADERGGSLLRTLDYLNVIGHIAPMVGLFGTVNGIISMFGSIAQAEGVPIMARISSDLGSALVATFWGLLIAIPSLTVFSILRAKVDSIMQECLLATEQILTTLQRRMVPSGSTAAKSA